MSDSKNVNKYAFEGWAQVTQSLPMRFRQQPMRFRCEPLLALQPRTTAAYFSSTIGAGAVANDGDGDSTSSGDGDSTSSRRRGVLPAPPPLVSNSCPAAESPSVSVWQPRYDSLKPQPVETRGRRKNSVSDESD